MDGLVLSVVLLYTSLYSIPPSIEFVRADADLRVDELFGYRLHPGIRADLFGRGASVSNKPRAVFLLSQRPTSVKIGASIERY